MPGIILCLFCFAANGSVSASGRTGQLGEGRGEQYGKGANPTNGYPATEEEVPEPSSPYYPGFGINAGAVEEIQALYLSNPEAVDPSWRARFESEALPPSPAPSSSASAAVETPRPPPERMAIRDPEGASDPFTGLRQADRYARVLRLIHFYRVRGHRIAKSDPLGAETEYFPELDPAHYGLGSDDMGASFITGDLPGAGIQTLREILGRLRATYCGAIGVEYMHVQDPGRKAWLQEVMEKTQNKPQIGSKEKSRILEQLVSADLFETFIHTKFIGQKRFSLEGADTTVPMLHSVIELAPRLGINEIVLGMSHRGRLNVLANVLGKSYEAIFSEFQDNPLVTSPFGSGDVKYHKGYSTDRFVDSGERVHLTLTSNPSHLEAVNPVVVGRARAKQVRAGDTEGQTVLPVLLHGDAAFAGQGIVAETLNLSQLSGYSTGGTLHIIINNQIGFTTTPAEARSTVYCSDIAKMVQAPIFHVNGDEPEAAIYCIQLAMEYRQRFQDDVVIDLVCYRRHGHNEGDEPAFTQPRLYSKIRGRPLLRELYAERLVDEGVLSPQQVDEVQQAQTDALNSAFESISSRLPGPDEPYEPHGPWTGFSRTRPDEEEPTAVPVEQLGRIAEGLGSLPEYFHLHPKLEALVYRRGRMVEDHGQIDWAMAEALAFGSLLLEGTAVRLSGQDCSRGTFSHRHAVFVDQESGEEFAPLNHLSDSQARFEVLDSLLSEAAVLGFEYGYSLADPGTLTLWEAQFGDFVNGAQVIIDQFITSAHVKWARMSGLVMLLPHGYEGQGPEHSSARVERFLQTCAEDCLQVVNCTTAAQYFHVLRRQMKRKYRAPMVIFSPKSLLRAPAASSWIEDLSEGGFQRVIDDALASADPSRVERVLLSFGKVYYDLVRERELLEGDASERVALVRIEELYPWPEERLREVLSSYANASRFFWVQEEPRNMGAWTFVRDRLPECLPESATLDYAGRPPSASTATGSMRVHRAEQAELVAEAFDGLS